MENQVESQPVTEVSQGSIHDRLDSAIFADDAVEEQQEVESTEEQTKAEPEEELEESQPDEDEAEDSEDSDLTTLTVDGEEFALPKEVADRVTTVQKRLEADHTRKTQEAAETRKAAQQFYEQTKQQNDFRSKTLDLEVQYLAVKSQLEEYENVDWGSLAEQDISLYSKHKEIRDGLREKANKIAAAAQQQMQMQQQQVQQEQQARYQWTVDTVRKAIPDYNEDSDKKAVQAAIQLGKKYGFDVKPEYLQTLLDPLIWIGLTELAKYQDLQAKRPEISKKVAAAPQIKSPVQKPRQSPKQQDRDFLRKTGKGAAKLLEDYIS